MSRLPSCTRHDSDEDGCRWAQALLALPSAMVHVSNPGTGETEAGGLLVWAQPGQHSETLSQKVFLKKVWVRGAAQLVQRLPSKQAQHCITRVHNSRLQSQGR